MSENTVTMSNTKTIAKNTGWYSVENIVSMLVNMVTSIAIARTLGPTKTGYLVYVTYIASLASNLGSLGIPAATRKYMAEFLGMGDKATARLIYFRTFLLQVGLASAATVGIVVWVLQDANAQYRLAAILIALSIWPSMVNAVPAQANSATEDLSTNVPGSISSAFSYLLAILATVIFHWGVTGIGAALLLMRSVDFLVRLFPTTARITSWAKAQVLPAGVRRRMISYAWQSVATMLLALIVWERCEVILLKHLCADIRQVAFYSIAFSAGNYFLLSATIFGNAASTTIFAQFGRDKSRLPQLASTSFRYLVLTSFPLHFIATGLAVPALLLFYGNQYRGAEAVVLIAPLLCMPKAFLAPIQGLLQSIERQNYIIFTTILAGAVDIGVAWALIPAHGAVGACIGSGVAQITAVGIMWAIGMRMVHVKLPWLLTAKVTAISIVAAFCAYFIAAPLPPLWGILIGGAVSVLLFLVLTYALRVLEPEDRERVAILSRMMPRSLAGPTERLLSMLIRPARNQEQGRSSLEMSWSMASPTGYSAPPIPAGQPIGIGIATSGHETGESQLPQRRFQGPAGINNQRPSAENGSLGRSLALAAFQRSFSIMAGQRVDYPKEHWKWLIEHLKMKPIRVDACLRGGDCGVSVKVMSRVRGDILYGSRPIAEWPHVKLLREFDRIGERIWDPGLFEQTDYYKNAAANIEVFGNYFDAVAPDQIHWSARRFVSSCFPGRAKGILDSVPARPPEPHEHIAVRPIRHSSCFQVVEGHHRLSALYVQGIERISAVILKPPVTTPLQDLLLEVQWLKGRRELYQPIDSPEVRDWTLVRRCSDRAAMMRALLSAEGVIPAGGQSYLDVACSYGWFVREMASAGFRAEGVEADPTALSIGQVMYGLKEEQLHVADAVNFLRSHDREYDVVSCFSLAHHFLLRRRNATAEELLRLLDSRTRRVLFFDMGEEHEYGTLKGWNPDFIQQWLKENTTFSRIVPLGKDQDGVPPNVGAFGRTLFACIR